MVKLLKFYLLLCISVYSADCLTAITSLMGQFLTFLASLDFFFSGTRIETILATVRFRNPKDFAHYNSSIAYFSR
jgi:hypothetical protein